MFPNSEKHGQILHPLLPNLSTLLEVCKPSFTLGVSEVDLLTWNNVELVTGDGKKLADVGLDDDHSICIWDWKKEEKLASTRGHKDMIFVIEWNPFNVNYLVSVGEKHIKFWTQKGNV